MPSMCAAFTVRKLVPSAHLTEICVVLRALVLHNDGLEKTALS